MTIEDVIYSSPLIIMTLFAIGAMIYTIIGIRSAQPKKKHSHN